MSDSDKSLLHRMWTRAQEALLARTLVGRRLAKDVVSADGQVAFRAGREIDERLLEEARAENLLEEVAHAAEPGTSDTELEDLLWWRKHPDAGPRRPGDGL